MYNLCIPSKLLSHFISPEHSYFVKISLLSKVVCSHADTQTHSDRALFDLVAIVSSLR